MAHNIEELVRAAAGMRATGMGWAAVGAALNRKESTVKKWPRLFGHHWKKYYEYSTRVVREETGTEAIAVLRCNLRSKSENTQVKAAGLVLKHLNHRPMLVQFREPQGDRDHEIWDADDAAEERNILKWVNEHIEDAQREKKIPEGMDIDNLRREWVKKIRYDGGAAAAILFMLAGFLLAQIRLPRESVGQVADLSVHSGQVSDLSYRQRHVQVGNLPHGQMEKQVGDLSHRWVGEQDCLRPARRADRVCRDTPKGHSMKKPLLIAAALLASTADNRAADTPTRPNILVIYADDQSFKTVGCYPESWDWVKTPNIDALAKSGVRFQGAYLGAWCMPSRASFLTGRQPHGIQSMRMEGPYPGSAYDPKQCPFWPALFRKAGYHTAQIGKWHTGTDTGFGRDWDYQIVWNRPKHPDNAGAYYEKQILAFNGVEKEQEGYPADNYTKWAVEYINGKTRDPKKPWFLWLCHGSIHGPSKPAARHKGTYKDAKVPAPADIVGPWAGKPAWLKDTAAWTKNDAGEIVSGKGGENPKGLKFDNWVRQVNECVPAVDESVGQVMAALKESGQFENTLVVYTADQGFAMGEHGMRMKIAGYDANYRSPLIFAMPGTLPAGGVCPQVANACDLVSTFFALSGVAPPDTLHGRDLTPLLKDPKAKWAHPCLYEHTGHDYGDEVAHILKDKPAEATFQKVPWYVAVVHDRWKLIHYLNSGVGDEMYDLAADPEELKNLIEDPKQAARLATLREALAAELKRTGAQSELIKTLDSAKGK